MSRICCIIVSVRTNERRRSRDPVPNRAGPAGGETEIGKEWSGMRDAISEDAAALIRYDRSGVTHSASEGTSVSKY